MARTDLHAARTIEPTTRADAPRSPGRVAFWSGVCTALAIAVLLLWQEHRAHLLGVLPWALVLLCPLVHVFMHGRHGHEAGHEARRARPGHRGDESTADEGARP